MENPSKNNLLVSLALGGTLAALFVMLVTISGELFAPLKNLLKEQHYHHWIGKGVWTMILFVLTSAIAYGVTMKKQFHSDTVARFLTILSWIIVFSALALFAFFLYEYGAQH